MLSRLVSKGGGPILKCWGRAIRRALMIASVAQWVAVGHGVVFQVTTPSDLVGVDGVLSLREAVTAAVTNAPCGDAVAGSPGYDLIRFPVNFVVKLVDPLTTIVDELEIVGAFSGGASLECNYGLRPFLITAGTSVTLDRLMIMRGVAPPGADGGAINNHGALTVKNGFFLDCVAPGRGGAI